MEPKPKQNFITLVPVLVLAVICFLALTVVYGLSRERIETNRRNEQLHLVSEVMQLPHDNDLLSDRIEITDKGVFNSSLPVGAYRARKDGKPVGLVLMPVMARGYNGLIELAVGIAYNGELTGVRVHKQRETEGLGDRIHQDHSDWIFGFDGHSLNNTRAEAWGVKSDGGEFDQLSGATISPRGVIKAVKNSLVYYDLNKDKLYKNVLNKEQKKFLRTLAHNLKTIIWIGQKGITENVTTEVNNALDHHELVKLKIRVGDRMLRDQAAEQICMTTKAETVQKTGNTIVLFRRNREQPKINLPGK